MDVINCPCDGKDIYDIDAVPISLPGYFGSLNRNIHAPEYRQAWAPAPIQYGVFIQVKNNSIEETEWALAHAKEHPFILGVVAGLDLTQPQVQLAETLDTFAGERLVGVRHIAMWEDDDDYFARDDVSRGFSLLADRGLTYDLLLSSKSWRHAARIAQDHPSLKIVVDHCGNPPRSAEGSPQRKEWLDVMTQLAGYSNGHCKLSSFYTSNAVDGTCSPWDEEFATTVIQQMLDLFGADRCMFGSDWPIIKLADLSISDVHETVTKGTQHLTQDAKDKVFRTNCLNFYNLNV